MLILTVTCMLAGCGGEKTPEVSSLSIDKEGKVSHQIVGQFEQEYYEKDILKIIHNFKTFKRPVQISSPIIVRDRPQLCQHVFLNRKCIQLFYTRIHDVCRDQQLLRRPAGGF